MIYAVLGSAFILVVMSFMAAQIISSKRAIKAALDIESKITMVKIESDKEVQAVNAKAKSESKEVDDATGDNLLRIGIKRLLRVVK